MRRHLKDPALIVALIALVFSFGGTAVGATYVITKSSQVRNGSLSEADLSAKARAKLRGTAGATGAAGPKGDTGPAGTPADTSAFYTRTESDGRFLATAATAANSALLGGTAASAFTKTADADVDYLRTSGEAATIRASAIGQPLSATTYAGVFTIAGIGEVQSHCGAGPAGQARFRNTSANSFTIFTGDETGNTFTRDTVAAGGFSTAVSYSATKHVVMRAVGNSTDDIVEISLWLGVPGYCEIQPVAIAMHTG